MHPYQAKEKRIRAMDHSRVNKKYFRYTIFGLSIREHSSHLPWDGVGWSPIHWSIVYKAILDCTFKPLWESSRTTFLRG